MSDLDFGSIYNPEGIPLEELGRLVDNKSAASKRGERFVFNSAEYEILGRSEVVAAAAEMSAKDEAAAKEAKEKAAKAQAEAKKAAEAKAAPAKEDKE